MGGWALRAGVVAKAGGVARFKLAPDGWIVWGPLPFGLGIGLYFALSFEPALHLLTGLAGAACILNLAVWRFAGQRLWLRLLSAALLLLTLGLLAGGWRSHNAGTPMLDQRLPAQTIEGSIDSVEPRSGHVRLILSDLRFDLPLEQAAPKRIRLRVASDPESLRPGQRVYLRAVVMPPSRPLVPGGFDFARRSYFLGIGGVGFALGPANVIAEGRAPAGLSSSWSLFWNRMRLSVAYRIQEVIPGQAGAVAVALITGHRGALKEETQENMRASGLAHLLAISGLHLGLIASTVFFSLRLLMALVPYVSLRWPIKKIAAMGALAAAFAYLFLAGATIPALRAFIMVSIALVAVLRERSPFSMRLVAAAAVLVLLLSPESLLSPSFQLSFAAVTALVVFFRSVSNRGAGEERDGYGWPSPVIYLAALSATSVIAILATTPFALHHFGRFTPYGLLANLVAVPLTAFLIMPAALVSAVLALVGLEALGLTFMGWMIDALLWTAKLVSGLPGASLAVPTLPLAGLLLCLGGGLWLLLTQGRPRWLGLPVIVAGLAFSPLKPLPDILVDETATLAAVRDPDGHYHFSSLRREKFTREIWMQYLGEKEASSWYRDEGGSPVQCDQQGCVAAQFDRTVAFSFTAPAAVEDCGIAALVISREPLRRAHCQANLGFYDLFFLLREGTTVFRLEAASDLSVTTVEGKRGLRPWTGY